MIPSGSGVGVERIRLCRQRHPARPIPRGRDHVPERGQALGVIGGKRHRLLRLMLEEIELLVEVVGGCGHHVRAPVGRIELNRLDRLRHDLLRRHRRLVKTADQADTASQAISRRARAFSGSRAIAWRKSSLATRKFSWVHTHITSCARRTRS